MLHILGQLLEGMQLDIQMLKDAFANSAVVGPIEEIDAQKGYRIKLGENEDGPVLSPWYPHPEDRKSWVPLKKGQTVGVIHPNGDPSQGFMIRAGYSKDHPAPSDDLDANVFKDAGVRFELKDHALIITSGDLTFRLSDSGLNVSIGGFTFDLNSGGLFLNGGRIDHDGRNIGSTHKHDKVSPGPALTGEPQG